MGRLTTARSGSASGDSRSSTSRRNAMQPMANEDGSVRLVFNGEIYNHAEIRRELEALGGHAGAPTTPTRR